MRLAHLTAAALGGAAAAAIVWSGRDLLWIARAETLIRQTRAALDDRRRPSASWLDDRQVKR